MNRTISELKGCGCDVESALERFLNNEAMYMKFLKKFLTDESYAKLSANITEGDYEEACRSVHTLKGVSGNLGLTPLYEASSAMVNEFRAGNPDTAVAGMERLSGIYNEISSVISETIGM